MKHLCILLVLTMMLFTAQPVAAQGDVAAPDIDYIAACLQDGSCIAVVMMSAIAWFLEDLKVWHALPGKAKKIISFILAGSLAVFGLFISTRGAWPGGGWELIVNTAIVGVVAWWVGQGNMAIARKIEYGKKRAA